MEALNKLIDFFKADWAAIVLIILGLIVFLKALASFLVNWAKATPDVNDDAKAEVEANKIKAIIQFFKDLVKPSQD